MTNFLIGISGGTASGKTLLTTQIGDRIGDDIIILRLDDYYKDQSNKTIEERRKTNYDHPDAFDFDLFAKHLEDLKNNRKISKPIYDFSVSTRVGYAEVQPKKIIIIEGIMIFNREQLRKLLDYKIFVSAPSDIRFIRRLQRDINERGRSIDSVIDQYLTSVKPMHDIFIEPNKEFADIIVMNSKNFAGALEIIIASIEKLIKNKGA